MKLLYSFLLLLLGLAASPARAQTGRAWTDIRALGTGTQYLTAAAVDAAGNFYEVGRFYRSTVVDGVTLTDRGLGDAFLAKYTPAGTLAWVRHLSTPGNDNAVDVAVDAAGNAYVVGTTSDPLNFGNGVVLPANGVAQGFVVRYSPQGTASWAVRCQGTSSIGGTATSVALDGAGQVYVAGFYRGTLTVGTATLPTTFNVSAYLLQLSPAGVVQWLQPAYSYSPSSLGVVGQPQLAVGTGGETYLVAASEAAPEVNGTTYPSLGRSDGFIMRFTAQGTLQWTQQYGSPGDEGLSAATVDGAGNLYLSGYCTQTMQFGAITLPTPGGRDAYLAKYSPAGVAQWAQTGGGAWDDEVGGLTVDAAGNAYLTGSFVQSARYGSFTLSSSAPYGTAMVVAYSPLGTVRWVEVPQGTGYTSGSHLGLDGSNGLHLLGRATGSSTWGSSLLTVTGLDEESFVTRLSNVLAAKPAAPAAALDLYPNPAHDQLQLPALPAGTAVQLVDAHGRVVRETRVTAGSASVRGLGPGLYSVQATDGQGRRYVGRVVVD
jgi:hypothetical protein